MQDIQYGYMKNVKNPLAEVFGYPITNVTERALRLRTNCLCPFGNKVPNCTKDKADNPLGICSIFHGKDAIITCPVRFREDWLIIENAAHFAFSRDVKWTSLSEIRLLDKHGQTAGNIDYVIISYDDKGKILDFASVEVQGVYISGNLRNAFEAYIQSPDLMFEWKSRNYPKPDYLSSSRKRLIPQMLYKGGVFKAWNKKQCVVIQKSFFETLPNLPVVPKDQADIAWLLYDLILDSMSNQYHLTLVETVYTEFHSALSKVTNPEPGEIEDFIDVLQSKLNEKLSASPDAPTLIDVLSK